ncbi:hypothetical protein FSB08_17140 [Paraburkholderia sp. JPY432]|uniref:hypothetical protein n=1 Tax=Paraburkholderia youngii TaxID=2782701 RepID=UPI001595F2A1|nr:hypothetical protein [Paraburkholderia youngii]NVH74228.1 hypothetical protein [Paraburkholderia youngii]
MPFPVITFQNVASCAHQGKALPVPPAGVVLVSGMGAVTAAHMYAIAGCTYPAMTSGAQACVTAKVATLSARVLSLNMPLAMLASPPTTGTCVPTGLPLIVNAAQVRVLVT